MRKYFVISAFTTLYLLFSSMSCEKDGHRYILLINNSDSIIYFIGRWQGIIEPTDTFIRCNSAILGSVRAKDTTLLESGNLVWEQDFGKGGIPFIQYFVFKSDYPIKHCHEDSIKELTERYQLKRYQLTKEDLDKMNWTITYP